MIQEAKDYFFFRRLKQDLSNTRRQILLQDFSAVKKVGLVYDATDYDMITSVRDLENKLKQEGKSVSVFAFIQSEEKKHEPFLFTKKDLNWYGYPKKPQLFEFASLEFDIVFGFFNDLNSPLNVIFANSKSKMRIGVDYKQDVELFDIIVGTSSIQKNPDLVRTLMNFIISIKTR